MKQIESFKVIGIAVRTTNENNQAVNDIQLLWGRFFSENIIAKIPNKLGSEIYSIYMEYEKDYTKPYTTIIGCKVANLDEIPDGMVGKEIEGGKYEEFLAKGNLAEGAVTQAWLKIWNSDLKRKYVADFEVYGEKAQNPQNAEVEIYVGIE